MGVTTAQSAIRDHLVTIGPLLPELDLPMPYPPPRHPELVVDPSPSEADEPPGSTTVDLEITVDEFLNDADVHLDTEDGVELEIELVRVPLEGTDDELAYDEATFTPSQPEQVALVEDAVAAGFTARGPPRGGRIVIGLVGLAALSIVATTFIAREIDGPPDATRAAHVWEGARARAAHLIAPTPVPPP